MKKTKIEGYREAFVNFSGVGLTEFELKEYWEDGPMLAKLKEVVYKIYSEDDMYNHFKESLTDVHMAMHIPPDYWIDVAEGVHNESSFVNNLIEMLDGKEEFEILSLALGISSHYGSSPRTFWSTLHSLSDITLYPTAIVAASHTYDLDSMISELMEDMLANGENTFTEMQNGVFEAIHLNENRSNECTFYIYTVDPISWEVK